MVDFQPSSNRSNVKNIARKREGDNIHTEKMLYPPTHHPPPTTPHPCPWRHYTGNVRQTGWQIPRYSPKIRRLVCRCLSGGITMCSKAWGGGGFPGKLCNLAWLVTMQRDGERRSVEGGEQLLQLISGWQLNPAGQWLVFQDSGSGSGFWLRTWIFRESIIRSTTLSSQEKKKILTGLTWWPCFSWLFLGCD